MKQVAAIVGLLLGLMAGGANASVFEGRNALNQIDLTCTVSGPTKCTSFYDSTLHITILNNWNIGSGLWFGYADAGSVEGIAAAAGLTATGLSGWVLPTGDGNEPAGPLNQYRSIAKDVGCAFTNNYCRFDKLSNQFDGVNFARYWSGSSGWHFDSDLGQLSRSEYGGSYGAYLAAVAVLDCDVADGSCQEKHPVPTPATIALLGLGLVGFCAAGRRQA